jgi:copper chaperone NosL
MSNKLPRTARLLVFIAALLMGAVYVLPMWRIELSAPQYPEGLVLLIYPAKLGGNVDIINGLNHYIGMKTLHAENFVEFTVLPYAIAFLGVLIFLTALVNKKKFLYFTTIVLILFSCLAMYDFWRWEYNYGHDLDPDAAIKVPGMAYDPPLIGYKQLLNFAAYSIPDKGGWCYIAACVILTASSVWLILKARKTKKMSAGNVLKTSSALAIIAGLMLFSSCSAQPQPIKPGIDNCDFCGMGFSDARFGGEILSTKGKVYKFDDLHCLIAFRNSNKIAIDDIKEIYFVDFLDNHDLKKQSEVTLYKSDLFRTPMNGNIAAFSNHDRLNALKQDFRGEEVDWSKMSRNPPAP